MLTTTNIAMNFKFTTSFYRKENAFSVVWKAIYVEINVAHFIKSPMKTWPRIISLFT